MCEVATNYVSTRGGELREPEYVLSQEVREKFLKEKPEDELDIYCEIYTKSYIFLIEDAIEIVNYNEGEDMSLIQTRKMDFFSYMENSYVQEEEIKKIINELHKDNITTKYMNLDENDNLPFKIINKDKYKKRLKELLLIPVLDYLLSGTEIKKLFQRKDKNIAISDSIKEKQKAKFYDILGDFEEKIREIINNKLEKDLKKCDLSNKNIKKLVRRLENMKRKDEEFTGLSYDLIDYATILEYKKIIEANFEKFKEYFPNITDVSVPFSLINSLGRRAIAHFRPINKHLREFVEREISQVLLNIENPNKE